MQQLVLPRSNDDLVDPLRAVDGEQRAHKHRDPVKRLQQLIFPAVACGASRCGDQCGTVRTRPLPALAKHFLQQAHWLNRSPLIASRR